MNMPKDHPEIKFMKILFLIILMSVTSCALDPNNHGFFAGMHGSHAASAHASMDASNAAAAAASNAAMMTSPPMMP
jgi:hypothetical protein